MTPHKGPGGNVGLRSPAGAEADDAFLQGSRALPDGMRVRGHAAVDAFV